MVCVESFFPASTFLNLKHLKLLYFSSMAFLVSFVIMRRTSLGCQRGAV